MTAAPTEREIKLVLEPGAKVELLRHPAFVNALRVRPPRLETSTYFDTEKLALRKHGYALRIRKKDRRHVQTLKKSNNGRGTINQRSEWEWKLAEDRLAVDPLHEILDPEIAGEYHDARPRFVTELRRQTFEILLDGVQIEAALDEGVVKAGDRDEPVDELELEVKNGPMAPAYRLALDLLEHNALRLGTESKADRGFRLLSRESAAPVKSRAATLPRKASLEEALICTTGAALQDFTANIPAAQSGIPEGVHQLRVALRRLRSMLVYYAPLLEPCASQRFSAAIRDLGRVLGSARDWDVFVGETLEAAKADGVRREWIEAFAEGAATRREATYRAVRELLVGKAPSELVLGMECWIWGAEWSGSHSGTANECIDGVMPALFDRLARKVARRGRGLSGLPPADLHPLRKSIKKLRYSAESSAELYGDNSVKRYAKRCKRLQTVLGAINDAQVTARLSQEIAPTHSAAWAPAEGAMLEWNARRQKASRKELGEAWRRLRRARRFWH